jgi:hypothetical protein
MVRMVPLEIQDGVVQNNRTFREVDTMVHLKSKRVLRYVTSWIEVISEEDDMGLFI